MKKKKKLIAVDTNVFIKQAKHAESIQAELIEKEAKRLLEEVLNLIKPIVAKIEASPHVTKNHYQTYMSILAQAPTLKERLKLAAALKLAGANHAGIDSALKLMQ